MFQKKYAQRLIENPVTVKVNNDTEEFVLRPMSKELLPSNGDAVNVLFMMESNNDWKNFIPFVTGLRMSKRKLTRGRWEYLLSKMGLANQLGLIIECARQSKRTGLFLSNVSLVERMFFEFHSSARRADFKGDEAAKALSLAKQAALLMETPEHSGVTPEKDPKRSPVVIGTLLELTATRSLNEFHAKDEEEEVATYARKLIASLPLGDFNIGATSPEAIDIKLRNLTRGKIILKLRNMDLIRNGMQQALLVHGIASNPDLDGPLKSNLEQLTNAIKLYMEALSEEAKHYVRPQLLFQA